MSNISIVQLSAYTSPVIQENKKSDYIEYGVDNNYFQYLIDRYLYSATNNAIITGVTNMIYGKGLDALDSNRKPNEYAQMRSIIKGDMLKKVALERKMLGMAAMQVVKEKGLVKKLDHFPMQTLRAEKCNDKGEIEAWYYYPDWTKKKPSEQAKRIPAFGFGNGNEVEIYVIKPYVSGFHYYTPIDYSGALPYSVLEEEIGDYLINDVQNGFSGTKVINFNNGIPPEEEMDAVERKVLGKLTGSKGKRVIVSFNHSEAQKTTVDDIPLNDAPEHYTYFSEECMRKIMLGHNVTSPLLFGISSSNGFSSNADELQNSFILYYNMVIQPYQDLIIEALDRVLAVNGISLKLYFETLKPLEFTDPSGKVEEPTELSSLDNEVARDLIALGEDVPDNWLLIDESPVDYDNDDAENELLKGEKKSLLSRLVELVSTGTARPNSKSGQDAVIDDVKFITRYVYAGETTDKSRPFCKKMIDAKKIYRKEDILQMSNQPVNAGWGARGADTYNIWFYKGGGNCHHRWNKQVYAAFEGTGIDVNSPKARQIAVRKAEKFGYVVKNDPKVSTLPKDMPNNGFLPKE